MSLYNNNRLILVVILLSLYHLASCQNWNPEQGWGSEEPVPELMQARVGDDAVGGTTEWTPVGAMFPKGKAWLMALVWTSPSSKADHKCT